MLVVRVVLVVPVGAAMVNAPREKSAARSILVRRDICFVLDEFCEGWCNDSNSKSIEKFGSKRFYV